MKNSKRPLVWLTLANNAFQESLSRRFRALLTGDPKGVPPWLDIVAAGDTGGLFLPTDAPWIAHSDLATLVGGVRALLMQALHPGSLAGVRSHSRYKDDPLGRLSGTIRWLTITTYGSHTALANEAGRVKCMHQRVKGQYQNAAAETQNYRADDPHLLRWVHIAFMESFLRSHQNFSAEPLPGGADGYIRLWAKSVVPLGLDDVPRDEAELLNELARYQPELVVNDATREVIAWIQNPPLPAASRPMYALLFRSAIASLPETYQQMIGQWAPPLELIRPVTRSVLQLMRFAIGPENPIADVAVARLHRIGVMADGKVAQSVPSLVETGCHQQVSYWPKDA